MSPESGSRDTDHGIASVRHRAVIRGVAALVVAIAGAWLAGLIWFVSSITDEPQIFDPPADGIVVLTGGAERLNVGLDLLKRGVAERLLISGVHKETGPADLRENSIGTTELFECCVDLDRDAHNTRGNASQSAIWARKLGYKRLIIVTADYHMPRTLLEFHTAMPEATLIAYPVRPPDLHLSGWWHYPGTMHLLAGEYLKYLFARVRCGPLAAPAKRAPA
jgi:uncharacterized SAM-binding protein YcdF (DUF218 family)